MNINIKITDDMEIIPLIKYWIPHLKVLEPKSLDEKILSDLEQYHRKY